MKISQKIIDIINLAETKFGVSSHNNDGITLWCYVSGFGTFQVGLERPTQSQLDCGEVRSVSTIKQSTSRYAFHTEAATLTEALLDLYQAVEEATEWDFNAAGITVCDEEAQDDLDTCELYHDDDFDDVGDDCLACEGDGCELSCCADKHGDYLY